MIAYEVWTVAELQSELRDRGLATSGSKAELTARLKDADAADQPSADDADGPAVDDAPVAVDEPAAAADDADDADEKKPADQCVVDDGTPHMGRAVNGKVCSAHAIHYDRNGKRRGEQPMVTQS
jgi:hypothetical protein